MNSNSILSFFLCVILISGCYSYPYYHDRYGNTLKPGHPEDYSKWYLSNSKRSVPQPFDMHRFGADVALESGNQPIEYLTIEDVNTLKEKLPATGKAEAEIYYSAEKRQCVNQGKYLYNNARNYSKLPL